MTSSLCYYRVLLMRGWGLQFDLPPIPLHTPVWNPDSWRHTTPNIHTGELESCKQMGALVLLTS